MSDERDIDTPAWALVGTGDENRQGESVTPARTCGKRALTAVVTDTSYLSTSMMLATGRAPGNRLDWVPLRTHPWRSSPTMTRLILGVVMACSPPAVALGAPGPAGRRPGPGPGMGPGVTGGGPGNSAVSNPAEFLLSQTGELKLTDAQVSRLAAIARRSAARRRALRAQMDSLRPQRARGERPDSAMRARMRQQFDQMRPQMERLREQSQA